MATKVIVMPRKNKNTTNKVPKLAKRSSNGGGGGGGRSAKGGKVRASSSSSGGSGGSASSGIKNSADKNQLSALKTMVDKGHRGVLTQIEKDVNARYLEANNLLARNFNFRTDQLTKARKDNEKNEHDSSFANLSNRAREATDSLAQLAAQGAGETDTLRGQLMSLRNWDANQGEINRSYYDTNRGINNSLVDLIAGTREDLVNAWNGKEDDLGEAYTTYYNQMADSWAKYGNLEANPYSDAYNTKSKAYSSMAANASKTYDRKGAPKVLTEWAGSVKPTEDLLNNRHERAAETQKKINRPEGATLNKGW